MDASKSFTKFAFFLTISVFLISSVLLFQGGEVEARPLLNGNTRGGNEGFHGGLFGDVKNSGPSPGDGHKHEKTVTDKKEEIAEGPVSIEI